MSLRSINILTGLLVVGLFLICFPREALTQTKYSLYAGQVYNQTQKQVIPFADVRFRNAVSGVDVTVRANHRGFFYARIPQGRYEITPVVDGQKVIIHSTCSALPPANRSALTWSPTPRLTAEQPRRNSAWRYDESRRKYQREQRQNQKLPGSEPEVMVFCEVDTVRTGQSFTLTVTAHDEDGLDEIWWYATYSKSKDLSRKHRWSCDGLDQASHSWTLTVDDPGPLHITADARDVLYGDGQGPEAHQTSEVHPLPDIRIVILP